MNGEDNGDHEALREAAVALRRAGKSRREIAEILGIRGNRLLSELLRGEPPQEWTKRPTAKDELRAKARDLRAQGKVYPEIAAALGVSLSSVSLWVRDMPKPPPRVTPEERARHTDEVYWQPLRRRREEARQAAKSAASAAVGTVSDRELLLVGAALYWAEGAKDKPYARRERVRFVNSDPGVISLFLRWLDLLGVEPERRRFALSIHETADADAALRFWAGLVGVAPEDFGKTLVKRHNPRTNRRNVGDAYRGCLMVTVLKGSDLYRRIEGWWFGIVASAAERRSG